MDKYTQLKRFHDEFRLQLYMYDFMYVNIKTMPAEDHFPATHIFLWTISQLQLQEQFQNIGLDLVTYVQNIIS